MAMTRIHIPKDLRQWVIQRAGERCEYCLVQQIDVPFTHHLDHFIPLKHGGETTSDNLVLACMECNRRKGADLAGIDPLTHKITPLFNPRLHVWQEHFKLTGSKIVGQTAIGRTTAMLLQLNESRRLIQRQWLIAIGHYP